MKRAKEKALDIPEVVTPAEAESIQILEALNAEEEELQALYSELTTAEEIGDYEQQIEGADGKVTHYTPQIMRAFVDEMLTLLPDAIILSGDLTLNGAKKVWVTNMLEEKQEQLPIVDGKIKLKFRPFEIKTILVQR